MRDKFIVRVDDAVLGLWYEEPCNRNRWKGRVLSGGPVRFADQMKDMFRLFSDGAPWKKVGPKNYKTSKVRYQMGNVKVGVMPDEWKAFLTVLRKNRYALESVQSFRRLVH